MKLNNYLLTFLAVGLIFNVSWGQNARQSKEIVSHYNSKKLDAMAERFSNTFHEQRTKAFNYARAHNLPLVAVDENGHKSYLYRMNDYGQLIYRTTLSVESRETIGADDVGPGGSLGLQLTGNGMIIGEWDGGKVYGAHDLLNGKVTHKDGASQYADHPTHVAGIMVGKELLIGSGAASLGIAYEAELHAYEWSNDISEMTTAAAGGLLVSNHSYGMDLSKLNDQQFIQKILGHYGYTSSKVDQIAHNAPYYTIVAAAGNDRGAGYSPNGSGFNILAAEMTTAKNDIVVAAVKYAPHYSGPASVVMSGFSSWGPTNDNRIKPDIAADGVAVLSSVAHDGQGNLSTNAYGYSSGTSMAAPSVAGGVLLLQQLSDELTSQYLLSATVKAILFNTALETGPNPGPDAMYGWGLMNLEGAAQLMIDSKNDNGGWYAEKSLSGGGNYTKTVKANGGELLKITIVWNDPAGSQQPLGSNPGVLVNDLDMRVTGPNGTEYFPWRLNPNNPKEALNDADNSVDNTEQIVIENPIAGEEYVINVSHKGIVLLDGPQDFSIAVSGIAPNTQGVNTHQLKGVSLYPNPAKDQFTVGLQKPGDHIEISVFDITGRQVAHRQITGNAQLNQQMNISELTPGIYFVKLNVDGKTATKKLIVE